MLSVLIIDDHFVARCGLEQILKEELRDIVFGEAATVTEALRKTSQTAWDLVILELRFQGHETLDLLCEIRDRLPQTKVLVFTMYRDARRAARALELGACGFLSKDASRAAIVQAVHTVLSGGQHLSQAMRAKLATLDAVGRNHGVRLLSRREDQVEHELTNGLSVGEIASRLNLSTKTISTYKRRLLDKLALRSTADLVRHALDRQL